MGVGDRIRKILEKKDLSQREFAESLNIAPTTLSGYITNKREPDLGTLKNISLKLEVIYPLNVVGAILRPTENSL